MDSIYITYKGSSVKDLVIGGSRAINDELGLLDGGSLDGSHL